MSLDLTSFSIISISRSKDMCKSKKPFTSIGTDLLKHSMVRGFDGGSPTLHVYFKKYQSIKSNQYFRGKTHCLI